VYKREIDDVIFNTLDTTDDSTTRSNLGLDTAATKKSDQNLQTSDDTTFKTVTVESVSTGQGFNELYPMDQAVRTTDDVTFNKITASLVDEETVELDNDFDSGNYITCAKIGNLVIVTGHGSGTFGALEHTSSANPASSSGTVPSKFRPQYEVRTVYMTGQIDANLYEVRIFSDGTFETSYTNFDETNSSLTSSERVPSVSYVIT